MLKRTVSYISNQFVLLELTTVRIQILNQQTDLHVIRYERFTIGRHPNLVTLLITHNACWMQKLVR
jgi:hypothetical protein